MATILISDASSLILLEKIDLLSKLVSLFELIIPEEVASEAITKGLEAKFPDAYRLRDWVEKKAIAIMPINDLKKREELITAFNVGKGEAEAIALWFEMNKSTVVIDDHKGMHICKIYNIPFVTALTLVIVAQERKIINSKEAQAMIRLLDIHGRYKDELIYEALKEIGENND